MWKGTIEHHKACFASGMEVILPGDIVPTVNGKGEVSVKITSCWNGECRRVNLKVLNVHDTSAKDSTTPSKE